MVAISKQTCTNIHTALSLRGSAAVHDHKNPAEFGLESFTYSDTGYALVKVDRVVGINWEYVISVADVTAVAGVGKHHVHPSHQEVTDEMKSSHSLITAEIHQREHLEKKVN